MGLPKTDWQPDGRSDKRTSGQTDGQNAAHVPVSSDTRLFGYQQRRWNEIVLDYERDLSVWAAVFNQARYCWYVCVSYRPHAARFLCPAFPPRLLGSLAPDSRNISDRQLHSQFAIRLSPSPQIIFKCQKTATEREKQSTTSAKQKAGPKPNPPESIRTAKTRLQGTRNVLADKEYLRIVCYDACRFGGLCKLFLGVAYGAVFII